MISHRLFFYKNRKFSLGPVGGDSYFLIKPREAFWIDRFKAWCIFQYAAISLTLTWAGMSLMVWGLKPWHRLFIAAWLDSFGLPSQSISIYPSTPSGTSTSVPQGYRMMACGKKLLLSADLTALSFVLTVQSVEAGRQKNTTPLGRRSAIPAVPTHTTPACSQWWRSNLTDWAQGFVSLKPLTYFYSHCRSPFLHCKIAELNAALFGPWPGGIVWKKKVISAGQLQLKVMVTIWLRQIPVLCHMVQTGFCCIVFIRGLCAVLTHGRCEGNA